jgi:hypothetical protein
MRGALSSEPGSCACATKTAVTPCQPPMLPLCDPPMKTAISPMPPMGAGMVYAPASAQRNEHSGAQYMDYSVTHRGIRGNRGESVTPLMDEEEELV